LREYTGHIPRYFRPPYGKITRKQAKQILKTHEIAMMDVMSCDYDPRLSGEECYQKVVRHAAPGSIVVFHDSLKAEERLRYVLPRILSYYSAKGYQFLSLSQAPVQLPPTR
ncbi:MAG: polysaccharide deacetylase family protein, partial [Bacteroidota bacterium]